MALGVVLGCLLIAGGSSAFNDEDAITVPQHGDAYSKYVAKLERGETTIDYMAFRESFLRSPQYKIKMSSNYSELQKTLEEKVRQHDLPAVLRYTKLLLDIDYTSMIAHKYRQQTFKILGDDANQQKYHEIEFGLLRSIVRNGDGKDGDERTYFCDVSRVFQKRRELLDKGHK